MYSAICMSQATALFPALPTGCAVTVFPVTGLPPFFRSMAALDCSYVWARGHIGKTGKICRIVNGDDTGTKL
jgi:hypothetical protein